MAEEWGPWIEHDGKGCPVPVGTFVSAELNNGEVHSGVVTPSVEEASNWHSHCLYGGPDRPKFVRRYQVKRPRGMEVLDAILTEIGQPVKEDA